MKPFLFKRCCAVTLVTGILFVLPMAQANSATTTSDARRIRFARGHESCCVAVKLTKQRPRIAFLVRTRASQRMSILVTPLSRKNGVVPVLNVISPAGAQSQAQRPKARRFDTVKTQAGDYRVEVGTNLMASNGARGKCRLKIWIR